jgi:hypothetical protein
MRSQGLYSQFDSLQDLENDLYRHLDVKVRQLLANDLPLPEDSQEATSTGKQSREHDSPLDADPRLCQPIEFGTNLEQIAKNFDQRMTAFDCIGMGPDKFLGLGAHTYNCVAFCLDRFLLLSAQGVTDQDRKVIERISTKLKQLAADYGTCLHRIPAFWAGGREICGELMAHQRFMMQMRR